MTDKIKRAAIVLNSPELNVEIKEKNIICADGGVRYAAGRFIPEVVVGDFDSAEPDAEKYPKTVICPKEKDYTDGERAVEYAAENGYGEITIYGAEGGRNDHVYANLSLLAFAESKGIKAVIRNAEEYVFYAEEKKGNVEIETEEGTFVSVLPFGDEVIISDSCGTKYEYKNLRITRVRAGVGISNEAEEKTVRFRIKKGSALIFVGDKKKIKFKTS